MNQQQEITAEVLLQSWQQAVVQHKVTLGLEQLPEKIKLYERWEQELQAAIQSSSIEITSNSLLQRTIKQLLEIWQGVIQRAYKLDAELKVHGNRLHIKSSKVVHDQVLQQLMLVILTLQEKSVVHEQQAKLYGMLAGHFVKFVLDLHTSRNLQEQPLDEILLLLKQEFELFPNMLDFKLLELSERHAGVLAFVPRPLLNLIFTQGLHTARFIIRTKQPLGMKPQEWDTLILATLLQDVGLTMGWGLGTPRQHILKGEQAEQQLTQHAKLGSALTSSIKTYPGIRQLIAEHHLPLNVRQFKLRTRLTTPEQQSSLMRMAIKAVHLLYHPIETGMNFDILPGLLAQQQMAKLLQREVYLSPQIVSPLLKVLQDSEDQLLHEHIDKLLPTMKAITLHSHMRVDQSHAPAGASTNHEIPLGEREMNPSILSYSETNSGS